MKECKWCGKPFEHENVLKLYCTPECYNAANRERSRAKSSGAKEKQCVCCGKTFIQNGHKQVYCSSECRAEITRSAVRERNKKKPKPKKKACALRDLNREAQKRGMSYGQYVAMLEGGMK